MMATQYNVATPYGTFLAQWGEDEESPVAYSGDDGAISHFKAYLELNSVSGRGGALVRFDSLEPDDLYGFCQSEKYGIIVAPSADDLMDDLENEEQKMSVVLDAVSDAEAFTLIGEGAQILTRLDDDGDTFFADLGRLREIIQALGDDTPALDDPRAKAIETLHAVIESTWNLLDPDLPAELVAIHTAHKDDAEIFSLFKIAVNTYSSFAIIKADEALNKAST